MKLAILHPFQFRFARGIERFTWSLCKALCEHNVEIDLLTWRWPNPVSWGDAPQNLHIQHMPYVRYLMQRAAIPFYLAHLVGKQYDWVTVYFASFGEAEALSLLRKFRRQRVSIVFHFPRDEVPHHYAEFERSGLGRRAELLVAVSHYVARGVAAQYGRTCAVIGNGVDTDAFHPSLALRAALRQQLGVQPEAPVLISLAALEERKGIQWVIRALPHLIAEFPQVRYWIVGEGPYRPTLESEVSQLGLARHVLFMGRSENVIPYLAAADIGCLLSHGESFGIAAIEAMAMELPVVTSCQPPFDELVRPGWGRMVNEKDALAVAAALRPLLSNPSQRRAMGQAGRQQVIQRHTWAQVADAYLRLWA